MAYILIEGPISCRFPRIPHISFPRSRYTSDKGTSRLTTQRSLRVYSSRFHYIYHSRGTPCPYSAYMLPLVCRIVLES